jgi:hypothetical protein
MFERGRQDRPPGNGSHASHFGGTSPAFAYDDGYDPARQGDAPMSPADIADEAAMALADDAQEYKPWILQRGTRPLMILHLRRYDAKAGHWLGWQMPYPQLMAVEYVGDRLLTLDFGTRQFAIEGVGLAELVQRLQNGAVIAIQEYSSCVWLDSPTEAVVSTISKIGLAVSASTQM